MKKGFVFCGINNLSQEICREIINRHTEVAQVLNIEKDLAWNSDETIVRKLSQLAETFNLYFMPDVPLNRMRNWKGLSKVQFLSSETFPGQLSIVLQVAALVQHQPTRFIHEVAALERSGIPELHKMGVEPREIAYLAFRNRLAAGATNLQIEHRAHDLLSSATEVSGAYFIFGASDSAITKWIIADAIYAERPIVDGRPVTIYFFDHSDGKEPVRCMEAWSSSPDFSELDAVSREYSEFYRAGEAFRDPDTKLYRRELRALVTPPVSGNGMISLLKA